MRVYKHLDREFTIDIFFIKAHEKSVEDTLTITELSTFRSYEIKLDLGATALRDRVKVFSSDNQKLGSKVFYRNAVRRVWLEKQRNNGEEFLQISVCENSFVRFIMVPEGKGEKAGWQELVEAVKFVGKKDKEDDETKSSERMGKGKKQRG